MTELQGASETVKRDGWTGLLRDIGAHVARDNVSLVSAGVAFYAFVAIPSALTAIVSLFGLAFDRQDVEKLFFEMAGLLPMDVINIVTDFLKTAAANSQSKLSMGLVIGVLLAVWSAQSSTSSMITALNVVYDKQETRGFIRFQATALAMTLCSIVFALAAMALITAVPIALDFLPLAGASKTAASLVRWPILFMLVAAGIAGVYRFAPAGRNAARQWSSWGVVVATILWVVGSALFSVYVSKFAAYDKTYGSLGAIMVLLFWLYLTIFIVLLGAELNAVLERRSDHGSQIPVKRKCK